MFPNRETMKTNEWLSIAIGSLAVALYLLNKVPEATYFMALAVWVKI